MEMMLLILLLATATMLPGSEQHGHAIAQGKATREYGVVVDAGSSGSKVRVYTWAQVKNPSQVPDISEVCWFIMNL